MLSLLLLFPLLTLAMPIIDLNDGGGGNWDNIPNYIPPPITPTVPVVPINNQLPIPVPSPFQLPVVAQPIPTPVNYDLGVSLYNQPQVPQYQVPQFQVQQFQVPQFQVPQYQVPQYQVPPQPLETPVLPQPTSTVPQPPPTTFPKAD